MKISEFLDNKEIRLAFYALIVSVVVSFVFPILGYLHKASLDSFNLGYKSVIDIPWLADFDLSGSEMLKITTIYTYTYSYTVISVMISACSLAFMSYIPSLFNKIILYNKNKSNPRIKLKKNFWCLALKMVMKITGCLFFFILSLILWIVFYFNNIENIPLYILCVVFASLFLAGFLSSISVYFVYNYRNKITTYNNKKSIADVLIFSTAYALLLIISVVAIGTYSGVYEATNLKNAVINGNKKMITLKSSLDTEIYVIRCESGNCVGLQAVQEAKELKTVFFKMDDIREHSI